MISKTEFFEKHGGGLVEVATDNSEFGDFLLLHPEEIDIAKQYQEKGYKVASVYQQSDEDIVDMVSPLEDKDDTENEVFKYGYFIIND